MDWQGLWRVGKLNMNLSAPEFWGLTFAEFMPLYDGLTGRVKDKNKMNSSDLKALNERWLKGGGNIRRISR